MPRTIRAADAAFLGALMVLAAALRLHHLDGPLWYDEIVTLIESVRRPLADIVTHFPGDNQHPLYSVLAHLSVAVFGEHPWSLRLPAALAGIATIPLLYRLGLEVADRREAAAAAVILTVSYHHVWFSQNARAYTLLLAGALLTTLSLLRWFGTGGRRHLVVFVLATALAAYAHLTMVLVAVGQAVACGLSWWTGGGRERLRHGWIPLAAAFAAAAAVTALLYAPMLADVGAVMAKGPANAADKATLTWTFASLLQGLRVGFGALWVLALGGLVVLIGFLRYLRDRPRVALLIAVPVAVTVGAALVLGRPLRPRFVFFAAGFALLVTVHGAAAVGALLGRRRPLGLTSSRGAALLLMLLTAAAVAVSARSLAYGYRYPKQDYAAAVQVIDAGLTPGDVAAVIADGGEIPVVRFLGRPWPRIDRVEDLDQLRARAPRVWVLYTFGSYIRSGRPALWEALQRDCVEVRRVPATVDDGSISVRRCP